MYPHQNSFNTIVNQKEVNSIKEMIFQRVRDRVATMTEDIDSSYTNAAQNDIMDMARDSFVSDTKNPFSQIVEEGYNKLQLKEADIKEESVGFHQRKIDENERQTVYREKINTENVIQIRNEAMNAAAVEFSSTNKGFIGALNFLNSQASVSLLKKQGKALDMTV